MSRYDVEQLLAGIIFVVVVSLVPILLVWQMNIMKVKFKTKHKEFADNPTNVDQACRQLTRMVHKLAKKWTRNHYNEYNDIVQQGFMGVVEAWNRFEGTEYQTKGYKFSTYAWLWIRAYMKSYAESNWKRLNNTTPIDVHEFHLETYSLDENQIFMDVSIDKLPDADKQIIRMRKEGYTFQEIAKVTSFKSLHKVRNRFLEICSDLDAA